eukprot:COSAG01_NODE_31589_length_595_cov_0.790323_1_plen_147_part_00
MPLIPLTLIAHTGCGVTGQAEALVSLGLSSAEAQTAATTVMMTGPAGNWGAAPDMPDMLRRAAAASATRRAEAPVALELLRLASTAVADVTGLGGGVVQAGERADFLLVEGAPTIESALSAHGLMCRRSVFRAGRRLIFFSPRAKL